MSRGVLRVVSKNGAPVPVNEAIITNLRQRLGSNGFIELCESSTSRRDDLSPSSDLAWPNVFRRQLSDERHVQVLILALQESSEASDYAASMSTNSD